jgi:hypothetical protein
MRSMGRDESAELEAAFARYRAAQSALRHHNKPPIEAVEAALAARVQLFRCLVDTGWRPPEPVLRQITIDAALVDERHGVLEG